VSAKERERARKRESVWGSNVEAEVDFFQEQTVTSKEHRNTVTVRDGYPQGFGWPVWGVIHTAFFFNAYDNKTTICA